MSKIWVSPWNFDQVLDVSGVFLREMALEEFQNSRIFQTTPEYTNFWKKFSEDRSRSFWERTVNKNIKINRSKTKSAPLLRKGADN